MKNYFYKLAERILDGGTAEEFILLNLRGEESEFVRLNHALIRQSGHVSQYYLTFRLIHSGKQLIRSFALTLDEERDLAMILQALDAMRERIVEVEEDPYLLYAREVHSTEKIDATDLLATQLMLEQILHLAAGVDLVGILASGTMVSGFANSAGQRNWFEKNSFNFDWSLYHSGDKAVKASYAGYKWEEGALSAIMKRSLKELQLMKRAAIDLKPGGYRVYLAPAAFNDFMNLLGWGGFGLKSQKTKNSALLKLVEGESTFHPSIEILEHSAIGAGPNFEESGFVKPERVTLVKEGRYHSSLASPRSAAEFGVEANGASEGEAPESLEMNCGGIPVEQVLMQLKNGIYLNHVHYLNYSDCPAGRITGITRFAAFYVENGEIVGPLNVMRFDESIYRMLGTNFVGATKEREMIIDNSTYGSRQSVSALLPGIIVNDFAFKG